MEYVTVDDIQVNSEGYFKDLAGNPLCTFMGILGETEKRVKFVKVKQRNVRCDRLLAKAFLDIPEGLTARRCVVKHLDGDEANTELENLSWISLSELRRDNLFGKKRGVTKLLGSYDGSPDLFKASITENGVSTGLGYYRLKEDAYTAYAVEYKNRHGKPPW